MFVVPSLACLNTKRPADKVPVARFDRVRTPAPTMGTVSPKVMSVPRTALERDSGPPEARLSEN